MTYGTIKVDTITFTDDGSDVSVSVSGLAKNPTISGNLTVTGNISGTVIQGSTTVSGATVTGTTANFISGVYTTQLSGATITGDAGQFTTLTGTTGNFVSGVFTTQLSGATITGDAGQFTTLTGNTAGFTTVTGTTVTGTTGNFVSGVFTTQVSGTTVTGNTGQFTTLTGGTAGFTTVTGTTVTGTTANFATVSGTTVTGNAGNFTTATVTSGVFASGTAAAPSVSVGTTDNGLYSPGTDQVALSTNGTGRLFIDSSGNVGIGTSAPGAILHTHTGSMSNTSISTEEITLRLTDLNSRYNSVDSITSGDFRSGIQFDATQRNGDIRNGAFIQQVVTSNNFTAGTRKMQTSLIFGTRGDAETDPDQKPVERVRITDTGNVGIGTTSPTQKLQITDGSLSNFYIAPGYGGGAGTTIGVGGGEYLAFNGAPFTTERMRIDSSGNVGIGTSSPGALLHVSGGNIAFGSTGTGFPYGATQSVSVVPSEGLISFGMDGKDTPVAGQAGCYIWSGKGPSGQFPAGTLALQSRSNSDRPIVFITGSTPTERVRIDEAGRVGIGTTTPSTPLHITSSSAGGLVNITSTSTSAALIFNDSGTGANYPKIGSEGSSLVLRGGAVSNAAYIDASGRLLVGTSTSRGNFYGVSTQHPKFQVEGVDYNDSTASVICNSNTVSNPATLRLSRTRGDTIGSNTVVANNDALGSIQFLGNDGTTFLMGAQIEAGVDGTPGANDMPGRLVFSVTADGAASPTEALRISSNRAITVSDGGHIVLGTGTGTKIGTSTSQKIGFFDETPIVQPTTGIAEAAFVENSGGTAVNVDSTFGGYTIQQVVQALQNLGLLA